MYSLCCPLGLIKELQPRFSHPILGIQSALQYRRSTMKEAIVSAGPKVKIVDSDVPKPGPDQVLIKVAVAGANPKDW